MKRFLLLTLSCLVLTAMAGFLPKGARAAGHATNLLLGVAAVSEDNAWAVGEFRDSSDTEQVLFEHWNGSTWEVLPSATAVIGSLQGVAATSEDNA
jgi:hypothetical protein